jgi:hypothetical protein
MILKIKLLHLFSSMGIILAVMLPFISSSISAQTPSTEWWQIMSEIEKKTYICYQTGEAIIIDGELTEASWEQALWTNYFVDLGPKKIEAHQKPSPVPHLKTRVKMLWDKNYFYIAAELEEPHIWATLLFHDQIICLENNFEVFIDPNADNHNYIEIEINALNTVWDLVLDKPYRDKAKPDQAWNIAGLKNAVYINGTLNNPKDIDKGWSVEMAIPWASIAPYADTPCPPIENDQWRVNFARTEHEHEIVQSEFTTSDVINNAYQKKEDTEVGNWSWSPHGVCNLHTPEMFGIVQFTKQLPGRAKWILDPTTEARKILLDIYYAQRDFFAINNKYVNGLKELGLKNVNTKLSKARPTIKLTDAGYHAWVEVSIADSIRQVSIFQDSKIIVE